MIFTCRGCRRRFCTRPFERVLGRAITFLRAPLQLGLHGGKWCSHGCAETSRRAYEMKRMLDLQIDRARYEKSDDGTADFVWRGGGGITSSGITITFRGLP